ncbi:helix-turn-helix transcriptional regulator [Cupriavidus sp. PET2-C1]
MKAHLPSPMTATASVAHHPLPGTKEEPRRPHAAAAVEIAVGVLGGQLYRKATISAITGLSSSTIDRKIKKGEFPAPLKLGTRTVAWRSADISAWMASLSVPE